MDRTAIFVDAGYFFAAGAFAAFGAQTARKLISLKSPATMLTSLQEMALGISGGIPHLRTYWYDAIAGTRLSLEQTNLAMASGVKLRLGTLNGNSEQKGVDSLIVTDLIDLARNRAISDAIIISGDEDLRIAVEVAQTFGVRVHILAADDPTKNVSPTLQMEADTVSSLTPDWFKIHFVRTTPTAIVPTTTPPPIESVEDLQVAAVHEIACLLKPLAPEKIARLKAHFSADTSLPPEFDRPLIGRVSAALSGRKLEGREKRQIRSLFIQAVQRGGCESSEPPTETTSMD